MRAQTSVRRTSFLIGLMTLFSMMIACYTAKETVLFGVAKLTGSQETTQFLAHRGSGRIDFKLGPSA